MLWIHNKHAMMFMFHKCRMSWINPDHALRLLDQSNALKEIYHGLVHNTQLVLAIDEHIDEL